MNNRYVNYHCHTQYSNVSTPDCTITNKQRGERAKELGSIVVSGVEHGWVGRFIDVYEFSKENNMKPLFGSEVYFVKNRFEKDRTNAHVIILAKNDTGRKALNWIISEANVTGFYYKARIDLELILSLPKDDVWVTTSCIGGIWKYEDSEEILLTLSSHFGKNLFLEVQPHNTDSQKELNKKILELSGKMGIEIIAGMDSHMIYPEQSKERDDYLLSRGISYPEEDGWFLDYPSYDEAVVRFKNQGVLNDDEIIRSMNNTLIFEEVREYKSVAFDKTKIKLPTLMQDKTQGEKNDYFENLIWELWNKEKKNVPANKISHYEDEIKKELDVVFKTGIADYFILDYEIIKRGKELGGSITMTGRGSAPSYYLAKLLGFTTIDRISATVKLFPERFISAERLLETKSLPDVDMNLGTPDIFAEAQRQIMGDGHSYRMIAFGTLRMLGAWKLYSRISGVGFDTSNLISEKLQQYEFDSRHLEEDEEELSVYDYIDEKYHDIYKECLKYVGLVNALNPHPCAFLCYSEEDIRKEFGLIKIKTGGHENLCVVVDGLFAEKYKMLKNDLLKVTVVDLIYRTYERIGIKPHTLPELLDLCEGDGKVWDIYKNACGMGINQVEQKGTIERVAKYSPTNISELSAFVAAIRPGFKSNYKQFETRQPFSYGIESLDSLIQTDEFPQSYMLYQENAMQVLAYAGIPISETYEVVKNIAKKRYENVLSYKERFLSGMKKRMMDTEKVDAERAEEIANTTWQIIEDSSRYSFNACISGSTHIQKVGNTSSRFNPNVEEMFNIMNDKEYAKKAGHIDLHRKYKRYGYGNALSMYDDGRIRINKIKNVYQSGIKNVYRVITENGSSIDCTMNHKFPTPDGDKKLENLSIGESLFVMGRRSIYQKGIPTNTDKIISIEFIKKEMVYDIEMESPAHNFISKSGLVTLNSHSYSVAGDSLYGAYLKSHYPIEFYETLMRIYEDGGDKDKLQMAKMEAKKHFKIRFPKYGFGQDNRNIVGDKDKNIISSSLKSIKGFGDKIGETLYELGKLKFDDFLNFLIYCEDNGLLSSKFESLIRIDYFKPFGNNKKLFEMFTELKKGKFRYSSKLTEKSKVKRIEELKNIWASLPEEKFSIMEQIENEMKVLEKIESRFAVEDDIYFVLEIDSTNSPKVKMQKLMTGEIFVFKIQKKIFSKNTFVEGQLISLPPFSKNEKQRMRYKGTSEDGKMEFEPVENEFDIWLDGYVIINKL